MLYKFKSKASGDVIMTESIGNRLLEVLGRDPSARGIFEPADLPQLIGRLEAAITVDEAARRARTADDGDDRSGEGLGLRQRAWPLVEMMRRAQSAGVPIVWGV